LQRLSFVIRQRVVVRLGLFSPDEIKIEMKKKQGNPTAHEMDENNATNSPIFPKGES
jgi:hypothetical protein